MNVAKRICWKDENEEKEDENDFLNVNYIEL